MATKRLTAAEFNILREHEQRFYLIALHGATMAARQYARMLGAQLPWKVGVEWDEDSFHRQPLIYGMVFADCNHALNKALDYLSQVEFPPCYTYEFNVKAILAVAGRGEILS